ncbi:lipase [Streptomyces longisporoflavus]|uniref:esterase/lipase family protein n=1 Tax=Streptomyces longisporoflavus TaxID=28044 RepID=UPI00167EF101|nr:alpha/beta fold hydrolase [Streptomyces longisporoflavus]GGV27944.1 lipase [Streptomyces longisporoflavus]
MLSRFAATAAVVCSLAALTGPASPAAASAPAEPRPHHETALGAIVPTLLSPAPANSSPPGARTDPTIPCPAGTDRRAHPRPVVLVHGTAMNAYNTWNAMAPALADAGYCVYALNHGAHGSPLNALGAKGTGRIEDSARELAAYVERVLHTNRARTVDLVGHSLGGLMPRQYMKFEGGASKVHRLVGLAPDNHGTTVNGLDTLVRAIAPAADTAVGPSVRQQLSGSPFLTRLNEGGDTLPGVSYTVVATTHDKMVTPYTSGFLTAPADRPGQVDNITLQQVCPGDRSSHLGVPYSPNVINLTLDALAPAHRSTWSCQNVTPLLPLP